MRILTINDSITIENTQFGATGITTNQLVVSENLTINGTTTAKGQIIVNDGIKMNQSITSSANNKHGLVITMNLTQEVNLSGNDLKGIEIKFLGYFDPGLLHLIENHLQSLLAILSLLKDY